MSIYKIIQAGESRSFPASHPFIERADPQGASRVFTGKDAGAAFRGAGELGACPFVAIELGQDGVHHQRLGRHQLHLIARRHVKGFQLLGR